MITKAKRVEGYAKSSTPIKNLKTLSESTPKLIKRREDTKYWVVILPKYYLYIPTNKLACLSNKNRFGQCYNAVIETPKQATDNLIKSNSKKRGHRGK